MNVWAIVLAAGGGTRFGDRKQFVDLDGRSVVHHALHTATQAGCHTVVVVPADVPGERPDASVTVTGGATRSQSVRAGLAVVPEAAEIILVHDAARPLASLQLWRRVIDAVAGGATAVVPVVDLVDSVRWCDGAPLERALVVAVQTPQGFTAEALRSVHWGNGEHATATDDGGLFPDAVMVPGEVSNLKITHPTDIAVASTLRKAVTLCRSRS